MVFDCGVWFAKYLLCLFNFLFFVLGSIVLATGVWLAIDMASLIALLRMVKSEHLDKFTQPDIMEQLVIVLIVIGFLMFFLSFLGYCGAIRESPCLLSTYGTFLVMLLIAEICVAGVAVFYKDKVIAESKTALKMSIWNYTAERNGNAVTLMWNQLMSKFSCCGVNDYNDFQLPDSWLNTKGNRTIPEACCILKDVDNLIPLDDDCVNNPTRNNSYYLTGCYEVLTDWLITQRELLLGIATAGLVQLVLILVAFALSKAFAKYHDLRL